MRGVEVVGGRGGKTGRLIDWDRVPAAFWGDKNVLYIHFGA